MKKKNEAGRLVLDLFLFFERALYEVKVSGLHLGLVLHEHSRIAGRLGKEEVDSLTPFNQFHPLHRQLDISGAITAEIAPLDIVSSRETMKQTV